MTRLPHLVVILETLHNNWFVNCFVWYLFTSGFELLHHALQLSPIKPLTHPVHPLTRVALVNPKYVLSYYIVSDGIFCSKFEVNRNTL